MTSVLEQVALGFDKAKKLVYDTMKTYYAKIDTTRSGLVNAFMSGIAQLYSTFQVFVKLVSDEHYISEASDIGSLYRLLPLAGVQLNQPVPMSIVSSLTVEELSGISTLPTLYVPNDVRFDDANGVEFRTGTQPIVDQTVLTIDQDSVYDYCDPDDPNNRTILLPLGKLTNMEVLPISQYLTDTITIKVPYLAPDTSIRYAVLTWKDVEGVASNVATQLDVAGSSHPSDIDRPNCALNTHTGLLKVAFLSPVWTSLATLHGLPVAISYTSRSRYLPTYSIEAAPLATSKPAWFSPVTDFWSNATFKANVLAALGTGILERQVCKFRTRTTVDVTTLKITGNKTDNTAIVYDFSKATQMVLAGYGAVYVATVEHESTTYSALLLDASTGYIIFADPTWLGVAQLNADRFNVEYITANVAKTVLTQTNIEYKVINPTKDIDYDTRVYDLEDTNVILFKDSLTMHLNDTGYTNVEFVQVPNVDTIQATVSLQYFEVQPLNTNKVRIRFGQGVDFSLLSSLLINYKTVIPPVDYLVGTTNTGNLILKHRDGTQYTFSGIGTFTGSGTNLTSASGATGIPDIETLRNILLKAAYTYDKYVTKLNYEFAIQNYFLQAGKQAITKVFDYDDFGTAFLNYTQGNIIYYIGLKNNFGNLDPVLVVSSSVSNSVAGNTLPRLTRAQLAAQVPNVITDVADTLIQIIGEVASDNETIRKAVLADSTMTNYLLSQKTFVKMYAVYFKVKIAPQTGYTFVEADLAVRTVLSDLFKWSNARFLRTLAVSDVYHLLDGLPEVDRVILSNMSNRPNSAEKGYAVKDLVYKTINSGAPTLTNVAKRGTVDATLNSITLPVFIGQAHVDSVDRAKLVRVTGQPFDTLGLTAGDSVRIQGFAANANNGVYVIDTITADYILMTADIGTTDTTINTIKLSLANNFTAVGLTTDKLLNLTIDVDGALPSYTLSDVEVVAVSDDRIILSKESGKITATGLANVTISDGDTRLAFPLWDFSDINNRKLSIDVLALGGIETGTY